jgi:hypothetical protein
MTHFEILLIGHADFVVVGILVIVLSIAMLRNAVRDNNANEWLFLAAVAVLPGEGIAASIVTSLSHLRPGKIDLYICWIDGLVGYPEFHIGKFVNAHLWASILSSISYSLLGSAMLATFAIYLRRRSECETLTVAIAFILNLFAAIPIYLLFPVCGPIYAFPDFPALPPQHLVPHLLVLSFPPNGLPSVHTSTALLVFYFLRHWHVGRTIGAIFLALTVFSTLGGGEHYLFDLICAIPYSIGIVWCADCISRWALLNQAKISVRMARR